MGRRSGYFWAIGNGPKCIDFILVSFFKGTTASLMEHNNSTDLVLSELFRIINLSPLCLAVRECDRHSLYVGMACLSHRKNTINNKHL